MTQDNAQLLLKEGIAAAKLGNKAVAYPLLKEATELDPRNELGWLWLAGVAKTPEQATNYLDRVLDINPFNQRALAGIQWVQQRLGQPSATTSNSAERSEKIWECPICLSISEDKVDRCSSCGVVLNLARVDEILGNEEADPIQVREAIFRLTNNSKDHLDFSNCHTLGLAYLNLGQIDEGISRLQAASQIRPEDMDLHRHILDLLGRKSDSDTLPEEERKKVSVLVVDDSPTVCKLVSITLGRIGHHIDVASDGLEALAKINDRMPDLILLDITMPRMDGYQLCKTIKSNQVTKDIPVIMLSGKDGLMDKVRGRMVGSSDYITKPFEPETLIKVVGLHA